MTIRAIASVSVLALVFLTAHADAQKPPAVRQLGRIERISTDSLSSVAAAFPLPGGNVLVNDITARRLMLFDSTLGHARLIADSTSATSNTYGKRAGTLIRYHRDSALFIDIASLSMLVFGPTGKVERVMAIPRPDEAQYLIGNVFGTPGFDAPGRLVYHGSAGYEGTFILCCVGTSRMPPNMTSYPVPKPDSAYVVRVDLASRVFDTAAAVKIPFVKQQVNGDAQGFVQSIETRRIPLPIVDVWAVTPDGSIAVVRGRDYHVDWLGADGHWTSFPKMPFDWQHLDDERKMAIIDSSAKAEQVAREKNNARRAEQLTALGNNRGGAGGGRGGEGGRGGGGSGPGGAEIPLVTGRAELSDIPDYAPAFTSDALYADSDNNLWIRTTTTVAGQPVYDIANRRGELVDRVQLPPFRTIAGFGPGVVFMAVKDGAGLVHLERARIK